MAVREYRVFGPPGTGKTSWLTNRIRDAAAARGEDNIMALSFTRTAALKLISRLDESQVGVERENVGTMHKICYHALGRPPIAETKIKEWNEVCPALLRLGDSVSKVSLDEPDQEMPSDVGDQAFLDLQLLRALCVPDNLWPPSVRNFARLWNEWKQAHDYVDFTDMIETALAEFPQAPGAPSVIMADEVQDFSRLELLLLRQWGTRCDDFVIVGDDDQSIYSWRGASPAAFLSPPVDDGQKRVLKQSYRLPSNVLDFAEQWIKRVSMRESKAFNPRAEGGGVERRQDIKWTGPEELLPILDDCLSAQQTIMILTSCSYMLEPILHLLREEGYAFGNPFRRARGDWNPLRGGRGTGMTDRLLSYVKPEAYSWGGESSSWTYADLKDWVPLLDADKTLLRGAKKQLSDMEDWELEREVRIDDLREMFNEQALGSVLDADPGWLVQNMLASKSKSMAYPVRVLHKHGIPGLTEKPKIIVGTIHSVKGEECDATILFPDLSQAGMRQWQMSRDGMDAVIRQFYVGMTRCRERLILCGGASPKLSLAI